MRFNIQILTVVSCLLFSFNAKADVAIADCTPLVYNYYPSDYSASNTNWSLAQDSSGYIYVANNSGLLMFNGVSWKKLYPFGEDRSVRVRSLYADSDRVYLGTYREFGYFEFDDYGEMVYTSLSNSISEQISKDDDIWIIHKFADKIFFLYFNKCYVFDLKTTDISICHISASSFYESAGYLWLSSQNGTLYCYDEDSGFFTPASKAPDNAYVLNVYEKDGKKYILTRSNGLYKVAQDGMARRIDSLGDAWPMVNRSIMTDDGTIILGTIGDGVMALNIDGNIKWHLDQSKGLQNNDVMWMYQDADQNIWVALDKGISVIYYGGPSILSLPEGKVGKITAAYKTDGGHYLIGSNKGLFKLSVDCKSDLEELDVKNQVWSISEVDGNIFIGENAATHLLNKDYSLTQLSQMGGGTKMIKMYDGRLVQGTFAPIRSYECKNGRWTYDSYVDGFYVPATAVHTDHLGNLWVEHIDYGMYKICTYGNKETIVEYSSLTDERKLEKIFVRRFGGRVVFADKKIFYVYDDLNNSIVPYVLLNQLFEDSSTFERIINATDGSLWVILSDSRVYHVVEDESGIRSKLILDCSGLNIRLQEECYDIVPVDDETYMMPVEGGLLFFNQNEDYLNDSTLCRLRFSSISAISSSDSENNTEKYSVSSVDITLPNASSIEFSMSYSGCKYNNSVILSYKLEGYDNHEVISDKTLVASYSNLPKGNYCFKAMLRNPMGIVLDEISCDVTVKASFWGSWIAIILYICIVSLISVTVLYLIRYLLKRQRDRLNVLRTKEVTELRNIQLEELLKLKSEDLAKYSLIEAQRNIILDRLREKITQMRVDSCFSKKSDYWELLQIIEDGGMSSDAWGTFYNNFDLVKGSFFANLSKRFPVLTQSDLRYCAYIRMNMSTKEISRATGLTIKGVEGAKYRLRKKMNIPQDMTITQFVLNLSQLQEP